MNIFDSHSHFFVIFKEFYSDFLNFSASRGLSAVFLNSEMPDDDAFSSFSNPPGTVKYNFPLFLFFAALHPWRTESAEKWENTYKPAFEDKLKQNKNLFIGETGLDRLRGADIETQKEIFRSHVELALKNERPFTIKCTREKGNCTDILREFFSDRKKNRIPFIVHGFSGSSETMKNLITLGGYISFSSAAIIKGNKKTLENIRTADPGRILIETDFPYSAVDDAGKIIDFKNGNEAGRVYMDMLERGYRETAGIMNISVEKLSGIIEENGKIFKDYTAAG